MNIPTILRIIYHWSVGRLRYVDIQHELREGVADRRTLIDWSNFLRDICTIEMQNRVPIGGVGHTVEIDESLFGHRKYHRGRMVPGQWVLGGIDRVTGECFMETVANRDAQTLIPIIRARVLPGTEIITDQWLAYRTLPNFNYIHNTVNHRMGFLNRNNLNVHTQRIESLWRDAKEKFQRMHGTRTHMLPSYLDEFCWRRQYGRETGSAFHNMLTQIAQHYPV